MSDLVERIIAARDSAKRFRDRPLLDAMADAANRITALEAENARLRALLSEAARLIDKAEAATMREFAGEFFTQANGFASRARAALGESKGGEK